LETSTIRVLVVDDYEPWRLLVRSILGKESELRVIGEASDGLEAIQKAEELQPDLILLDIGLPKLNGIAAARSIRLLAPFSRIIFVSQTRSSDIVHEALGTGGNAYVVKANGATELLPAVAAVLQEKQFVSANLVATPAGFAGGSQP
jgi:DNA-binding NarL/FixJ family response regulator